VLLALLALVTLGLKLLAERHMSAELSAARDVPAHAGPLAPGAAAPSVKAARSPNNVVKHPLKQGEL